MNIYYEYEYNYEGFIGSDFQPRKRPGISKDCYNGMLQSDGTTHEEGVQIKRCSLNN
jgi:hypothetical protein